MCVHIYIYVCVYIFYQFRSFRTVVLNLWVMTPLGAQTPLSEGLPITICISYTYIKIHNSSKFTVMK